MRLLFGGDNEVMIPLYKSVSPDPSMVRVDGPEDGQWLKLEDHKHECAVFEEALRIACDDAWPGQTQWLALYLQRARSNISKRTDAALEATK